MHHMSFVEGTRQPGEKPLFSMLTGVQLDSVFIQVTLETYLSKKFQQWLNESIFTRITPGCQAIRIAIMTERAN
jgi:hypothetical protein